MYNHTTLVFSRLRWGMFPPEGNAGLKKRVVELDKDMLQSAPTVTNYSRAGYRRSDFGNGASSPFEPRK